MSAIDDLLQEVRAFDYKWFDEIGGNQAQVEVGVLRKTVVELRDTLAIVDRNLQEQTAARDKLADKLNDWAETYNNIIADKTCPDEVHCACVPALREEIDQLRNTVYRNALVMHVNNVLGSHMPGPMQKCQNRGCLSAVRYGEVKP